MNKTRSKTTPVPAKPASKAQAPGAAASPRRKPARKPVSEPWSEVANFVVTFESRFLRSGREERRITAHKMQEGGITATWIGAEQHPMCQWIAEHVGEGLAQDAIVVEAVSTPLPLRRVGTQASEQAPGLAHPPAIAIAQLRALPAPPAPEPAGAQAAGLTAFDIEAVLDVRGAADTGAEPVHCPVDFYIRNLLTAQKSCLGSASTRQPLDGGSRHAATLLQVRLPAGTYRIDCATKTPGAEHPFAYLQGPVLQVA